MRQLNRGGWLVVGLVVAWCGCRGLPRLKEMPTEEQEPAQQLIFHSDFPLPQEHRLLRELTLERDDICRVLELPCSEEPIHVYLFRDSESYGQYVTKQFPKVPHRRAFFVESDTRLAVYAHWGDRIAEDLRHEVAHGYLHAVVSGLPLWLDEGLAEYFEVPRGHGGLNRPHVELLAEMLAQKGWQPDLPRLETLLEAGEMEQKDYAESWAWVHFLLETEPDRHALLIEHLRKLREEGSVEPLSKRLASLYVHPEQTLAEYILSLHEED